MFSSNQVLKISGSLYDGSLENSLGFALSMSDKLDKFVDDNGYSRCVYQITSEGYFAIGWSPKNSLEKGWNWLDFKFDLKILSQMIINHLSSFYEDDSVDGIYDGAYEQGYLMSVIPESLGDYYDGIRNPFYGIVVFEPFICHYSK